MCTAILTAAQRQMKISLIKNSLTSRLESRGRAKNSEERQQNDGSLLHPGRLWDALIFACLVGLADKMTSMLFATVDVPTEASH